MSEELGWSLEDFDKAFQEVFKQGMVKADFDSRVVWIPNAIKHNRPESPNVVISWGKEIDLIPECVLKNEAINTLYESVQLIDSESDKPEKRSYSTAFEKAFSKALRKACEKAYPNQEQEQEQEQNNKPPHNAQAREGEFSPDGQPFQIFDGWSPTGLSQQEYTPEELEDFVLFWSAGGQVFNQAQWEQKFARSVQRYRKHAKTKKSGGLHAKQNTANANAFEQVRARHNEWRVSQGLAPLGDDGGDIRQPLGEQERGSAIHDLGPDDFEILG